MIPEAYNPYITYASDNTRTNVRNSFLGEDLVSCIEKNEKGMYCALGFVTSLNLLKNTISLHLGGMK